MADGFLNSLTIDSRQKPLITFSGPPPVGFQLHLKWFRRNTVQTFTLEKVDQHIRRWDGAESYVLTWRDQRGIEYKSGLRGNLQKTHPPLIDFAEAPEIGHRLTHNQQGEALARPLTLAAVEPYTRKTDGGASYLLTWRDAHGVLYRSGMRGPYPKPLHDDEK